MPRRDYDSDLDDEPPRRRRRARRKPDNRLVVILLCLGFGLLFAAMAAVGLYVLLRDKPTASTVAASDLERLAGSWECTFRDPAGQVTIRKVKMIAGTTETATWYRADGTVFRINRVEFALDVGGRDKVFRYFNGWVIDGPGAGQPFPSGEYVYSLEGDTWTEYDPGGVIVWTRKK